MPNIICWVNDLIQGNGPITDKLPVYFTLILQQRNIVEITEELGYFNHGLQHILTDAHQEARKAITTALLH